MRVVGIIGYKKSGKTNLLVKLARELADRGHIISTVKHASCDLDLPETDTALHKRFAHQVAAISPQESAIFFRESLNLEEMLNYLRADFILIEGFKKEKTFPKIVCLRPDDDPETLLDGLEICVVGSRPDRPLDVPFLDADGDISEIADLVEKKAFKLPNLDCEACGYKTCYEMALQIIRENRTTEDCKSLYADVQIKIDDRIMPVKPFVADIVRNTVTGMLSSLKGYGKGRIEIVIESRSELK